MEQISPIDPSDNRPRPEEPGMDPPSAEDDQRPYQIPPLPRRNEDSQPEDLDSPVARRPSSRVDPIRDDEPQARRREMTPGRTVHFRMDPEGDVTEEMTEGMSRLALERALRAAELRNERLMREIRSYTRQSRDHTRSSTGSMSSTSGEGLSRARPKLKPPETFKGDYTELYNVLNWLHQIKRYLNQCDCNPDQHTGFARSYLGHTVQAWMDAAFPGEDFPDWEEFEAAMIERFLPPDHDVRGILSLIGSAREIPYNTMLRSGRS